MGCLGQCLLFLDWIVFGGREFYNFKVGSFRDVSVVFIWFDEDDVFIFLVNFLKIFNKFQGNYVYFMFFGVEQLLAFYFDFYVFGVLFLIVLCWVWMNFLLVFLSLKSDRNISVKVCGRVNNVLRVLRLQNLWGMAMFMFRQVSNSGYCYFWKDNVSQGVFGNNQLRNKYFFFRMVIIFNSSIWGGEIIWYILLVKLILFCSRLLSFDYV